MIAMLVEDMLAEAGCEHVHTVGRLKEALEAAENGTFDFAILDLSLAGHLTYPVADVLKARSIPLMFVTGYGAAGLKAAYADSLTLQKPFRQPDLESAIARLLRA
jgi:CheY-like chemotaxis protein